MFIRNHTLRLALAGSALVALSPSAQAANFIFSTGLYAPGITAPEPLAAGDVLQIVGGGNKFFSGVTLTNQGGQVSWGDSFYMQNGATIANQALWTSAGDFTIFNNGGATSTFNNSGTFRKTAGVSSTIGNIAFVNSGVIDAQAGTINFAGGNAAFNAGSAFIGAGSTTITSDATFNGAYSSSNLVLASGTLTGGNALASGTTTYSGGFLTGNWSVVAGQTMNAVGGGNKFINGATLTNNGTLAWQTSDAVYFQNAGQLVNNALVDVQANTQFLNNGGATSTFTNASAGTLRTATGVSAIMGTIAYVNNGGTIRSNGTLSFNGSNATFNAGTSFVGTGTTSINSDASFVGAFTASNLVLAAGTATGSGAQINGNMQFSGGFLAGGWTVASGQTLSAITGGNKFINTGTLTNNGTLAWQTTDAFYFQNAGQLVNNALVDLQANTQLLNNGGATSTFTNASGGTLQTDAGVIATMGTIAYVNNGGIVRSNGTLNFNGSNATFNAGTSFVGTGTTSINTDASFVGAFTASNLVLAAGTATGTGAQINGNMKFSGGFLADDWTIASGQTLSAITGGNKFINTGTLTNNGTLAWLTTDAFYFQNAGQLTNNALVDFQATASVLNNGGATSTFNNASGGTVRVKAGESATIGGIAFVNDGTLTANGTLNFNGSNATFNGGGTFNGAGATAINTSASFNGTQNSSNLSLRAGNFSGSGAILAGSSEFAGGFFAGTWSTAAGATLHARDGGNKFFDTVTFTNQGTLAWETVDSLYLENGGILLNQGTIDFQADSQVLFNGGAATTFANTGLIKKTIAGGVTTINGNVGFSNASGGTIDVESGTLRLPDNFSNDGTMKGIATFQVNGTLTNNGHLAPGNGAGTLTLNGNYMQTGGGFFDAQLASTSSFDLFNINGTANLGGTLALSCIASCAISTGDVFTILDSTNTLSGTFASVTTSGFLNGFQYSVIYDYAASLVKLQVINAGAITPPPAGVPEPQNWALMIAGMGLAGGALRRRRGRVPAVAC